VWIYQRGRRYRSKIGSREAPFFVLRERRELRALSVKACLLARLPAEDQALSE
jgi:hypothetical protein